MESANEAKIIAIRGRVSTNVTALTPQEKAQNILHDLCGNGIKEISKKDLYEKLQQKGIVDDIDSIFEKLIEDVFLGNEFNGIYQIV